MSTGHESSILSYSPSDALESRKEIFDIMQSYQATDEEKERSLGLFLRGSLLARILGVAEIYQKIVSLPGIVMDIGTWRGQTAVLCENLRAIYEPLHFNRRIVCFDTFEGYAGFSDKDKSTELHKEGTYDLGGEDYSKFLSRLLVLHERSNAMGNYNGKHKVIKGDCRVEIPKFFTENPGEFVSLAFFDVNSYDPTLKSFGDVWDRLVPGGIVAFWQISRGVAVQAEGQVYADNILTKVPHKIYRSSTYPGLCYLVK
ncbi:class I SAM-dependent methyltransferase [Neorhizobium tomejilense]|uniref:class I SAM-dependent methyltransferase n=1 Tax=Neorhizobium tomejilense TaxID=2093828 RepID=UPI000CF922A4|nr:class I SAM-dependent methyltransferase [Neorhizobium tomejilense]